MRESLGRHGTHTGSREQLKCRLQARVQWGVTNMLELNRLPVVAVLATQGVGACLSVIGHIMLAHLVQLLSGDLPFEQLPLIRILMVLCVKGHHVNLHGGNTNNMRAVVMSTC